MYRPPTDKEKAAIFYHVYGGMQDWQTLFAITLDRPLEASREDKYLPEKASRWKRSEKIQTYLKQVQDARAVKEAREKEEILRQAEENVRKKIERETGRKILVDYGDPANQRRKLNELINDASDPGEALDALKVIISGQKDDRQAAREQKQVRAYLPLTCADCPLYRKFAKKTPKP